MKPIPVVCSWSSVGSCSTNIVMYFFDAIIITVIKGVYEIATLCVLTITIIFNDVKDDK